MASPVYRMNSQLTGLGQQAASSKLAKIFNQSIKPKNTFLRKPRKTLQTEKRVLANHPFHHFCDHVFRAQETSCSAAKAANSTR